MIVRERKNVIAYIEKRQIGKQYFKAKKNLENNQYQQVDFKLRKPNSLGIYQFRVSKKYRAFGHYIDDIFVVASISDHQL